MKNKLTLSVEKSVIEKAKAYAKQTGRSLSELIESYPTSLTEERIPKSKISTKLKRLIGSVKLPKGFDEKKELEEYLKKKSS